MVVYLVLGIALAVGVYLVAQGLVRANPRQIAVAVRIASFIIAAVVIVFLAVSGRLSWILFALPILLPWLMRLRTLTRLFKAARGPSEGQSSRVETPALAMELDHDTGEMDGDILAGPMEGRRLSDLDAVLLIDLYRWCCANDEQAARLLEAYLDRTLGADWREQAGETGGGTGSGGDGGGQAPGGMTEEEALSILGLEPGASADEVRAAHRRLMRHAHPDRGGSAYLAAKINAAKDLLLDR
jgi:hypothetical protein